MSPLKPFKLGDASKDTRLALTILLIEDSPDYSFLLQTALQDSEVFNISVIPVSSLQGAKDVLAGLEVDEDGYFDLIISDLMLPDSRVPRKTLAYLSENLENIPVIAVTGASDDALLELTEDEDLQCSSHVVLIRKTEFDLDNLDAYLSYSLLLKELGDEEMKLDKFSSLKYVLMVGGTTVAGIGAMLLDGKSGAELVGWSLLIWGVSTVNYAVNPGKPPVLLDKLRARLPF